MLPRQRVHCLVGRTTDSNELKYHQDALYLIDSFLCREVHDDFECVTAENTPLQDNEEDAGEQGGGGDDGGVKRRWKWRV